MNTLVYQFIFYTYLQCFWRTHNQELAFHKCSRIFTFLAQLFIMILFLAWVLCCPAPFTWWLLISHSPVPQSTALCCLEKEAILVKDGNMIYGEWLNELDRLNLEKMRLGVLSCVRKMRHTLALTIKGIFKIKGFRVRKKNNHYNLR